MSINPNIDVDPNIRRTTLTDKVKRVLLEEVIPAALVLGGLFTAIWVFDTYISEWWHF